jgi:transketolase
MLNPNLNLNQKIFDDDAEVGSMRQGFGEGIIEAAKLSGNVVALTADLAESLYLTDFRRKFPDRFVEVGVAEQNLVTVASGMAAAGKIPFTCSYAVFSPGRNWEQIRTTICYNNVPVKIIGSHAGVTVGPDGGSHQALEDIAMMRVLPRMIVISPCDQIEARKATVAASNLVSPVYIRLARDKTPIITSNDTPFVIGKAQILFASNRPVPTKNTLDKFDVGIVATGPSLARALRVARKLDQEAKMVQVMNVSTIKPLDQDAVIKIAHECGAIVTVEDHQKAGGLGSTVSECLSGHFPIPIEFVGIDDRFGQSGTPAELIAEYGIDESDIYEAAKRAILRKR